MATITKPIALDESLNTSETPSRNIADVLAQELSGIATALTTASNTRLHLFNKLWENPSPSSAFSAQTITLASSDYDYLLWACAYSKSNPATISNISEKGTDTVLCYVSSSDVRSRYVTRTSDTKYTFGDGKSGTLTSTATINNDICIPIAVYGFKKSVDINAIVSSVSTDADKCIMSDGVTSVEQAITANNLSSPNVVSSGVEFMCPSDGYLQIRIGSGKEMIVRIYGHNKTQYITYDYKNASSTGNYEVIFVRKGMYVQSTYANDDGHIYFYPLV